MNEEEIRLDQTIKVFKAVQAQMEDGDSSFRNLIYGRLGFKHENYVDLYEAGGMKISNWCLDYKPLLSDAQELAEYLRISASGIEGDSQDDNEEKANRFLKKYPKVK